MRVRLRVKECTAALTPGARPGPTVKAAKGVVPLIAARCSQGPELGDQEGMPPERSRHLRSRAAEAESCGQNGVNRYLWFRTVGAA